MFQCFLCCFSLHFQTWHDFCRRRCIHGLGASLLMGQALPHFLSENSAILSAVQNPHFCLHLNAEKRDPSVVQKCCYMELPLDFSLNASILVHGQIKQFITFQWRQPMSFSLRTLHGVIHAKAKWLGTNHGRYMHHSMVREYVVTNPEANLTRIPISAGAEEAIGENVSEPGLRRIPGWTSAWLRMVLTYSLNSP